MAVITVSSQFGAGGPAVGKQLAERLGLDYMDKDILHRIALDLGVPTEKVEEFDEAQHNRLRGFLSTVFDFGALKKSATLASDTPAPTAYDDREEIPFQYQVKGWIDRDIYRQMVVRVISAVGQRGGAVIKGRGSQCILKDNPKAIHVRFVASLEDRIARTAAHRGISQRAATELISQLDKRGGDYVQAYFGCDLEDDALYHLVVNSSKIPLAQCLDLLVHLVTELEKTPRP